MKEYWDNMPVQINNLKEYNQILTHSELLIKINSMIDKSNIQLDYKVYKNNINNIYKEFTDFINSNYIISDTNSVIYSYDLIDYYCNNNSLLIEFYAKGTTKIIGYIVGKKQNLFIYNNYINTIEVNFLCIIPKLRNINMATYLINVLTRETVINYNIATAHYTVARNINSPHFSEKKYYHRLINIKTLQNAEFLNSKEDTEMCINIFNKFYYTNDFNKIHLLEYYNNNNIKNYDITVIKELYEMMICYYKKIFKIFHNISFNEFYNTFTNNSFYHFIIKKDNNIISYLCFFKLESINNLKNEKYVNGYLYNMFFNDMKNNDNNIVDTNDNNIVDTNDNNIVDTNDNNNIVDTNDNNIVDKINIDKIINSLELVNEYIYNNNIFDVVTILDIFDFDYNKINLICGSGLLRYYFFNTNISITNNNLNQLITI